MRIVLNINNCRDCPFLGEEEVEFGETFGTIHYCSHPASNNKQLDSDTDFEIPEWCPLIWEIEKGFLNGRVEKEVNHASDI